MKNKFEGFPEIITKLPEADIPMEGLKAYLLQGEGQQAIFMDFEKDVELKAHHHAGQWGIVLSGKIDLVIGGIAATYEKGDTYYIPGGVMHSGYIHKGYSDISIFDPKDRYRKK